MCCIWFLSGKNIKSNLPSLGKNWVHIHSKLWIFSYEHSQGWLTVLIFVIILFIRTMIIWTLPQNVTLNHFIGDIVLIGSGEQEMASTVDALGKYIHAKAWEINHKYSGPCNIDHVFRSLDIWGMPGIPFKGKEKLLHLSSPTTYYLCKK